MRWILPSDNFFTDLNVPKLQFVPVLLEDDGSYPFEANCYLAERSNGEWAPGFDADAGDADPVVPTLKSRTNMASRLCAFLRWCRQAKQRDWRTMQYQEHILEQYQVGLLRGTAATTKRPLEPDTVNVYVDEACGFLSWAAQRGYRGPFKVSRRRRRVAASQGAHSHSHRGKLVEQRNGKLQSVEPSLDGLPIDSEIVLWMRAVRVRHPVKALMFELMARTGARISEANQMRVSCFPRKQSRWKEEWQARGTVPVTLRFGVKGGKVQPASMLSTRTRILYIPIDLADRIEHYIQFVRPTLLSRFHQGSNANHPRTDRLWLGEKKGQAVSNQMLYKAWVGSAHCPPDWHPHAARHYFAVETICNAARQLMRLHQIENPTGISLGWLHGLLAGQVRLILSPLLGHVDEATTMRYLRCAHQRMVREMGHPALDWNALIDADMEAVS